MSIPKEIRLSFVLNPLQIWVYLIQYVGEWWPLHDSSDSHHSILSYSWSTSDSSTIFDNPSGQNTNVYVQPTDSVIKAVEIQLVITNEFSCSDTSVSTLYVLPSPVINIAINDYGCDSVTFQDVANNLTDPVNFGDSISFTWAITNGLTGVTDTFNDFLPNYLFLQMTRIQPFPTLFGLKA